ncbi:cytochrome P450 oxidoreductase [Lophiostoma macrostomum CBS 122681]|uniref:Cytochrome P450 oxidoreductase n=1 Tax=Lophiostoma macrostomum CBS 122681 TaxID=1314788 RepID=A0A6A6T2S5_9PLEO|nr:cytochrome P450 oxidoreductase [Lophiostoma macrostomum CBS 122681]
MFEGYLPIDIERYSKSFALSVGIIALLLFLSYHSIKYLISDLPPLGSGLKRLPGPTSTLPYLGRVHDLDRMRPWKAMKTFSDRYGGLFSCTLGGDTHIWIARDHIAQDLLCKHSSIASARADLGAYPEVTKGFRYLPLLGYTEHLVRQRRFAHLVTTRDLSRSFEGYMALEAKRFLVELIDSPQSFFDLAYMYCGRISSRLAYGTDTPSAALIKNALEFIHQIGPSGPATNLLPVLRFLPEWIIPGKRPVRLRQEAEETLWKTLFEETRKQIGVESPPTYVSASVESREHNKDDKFLFENEMEAVYAVGMMCTVAIVTIAGPITLFILAMVLHPDWQEKVRAEIDQVTADEFLDLEHSSQLPTLRGAIKECLRWKSTVPLGVPHVLGEDYSYDGYHFPKNAIIHVLDIAMSRDSRYVDPDVYNPDRWLDEQSPNYKSPLTEHPRLKGHHIFGRGKRMCPGQDMAEAELLVLCGNLLKFFVIKPALDGMGEPIWPDPERWTVDVIGGPLPFDCEIKPRSEAKQQAVMNMRAEFKKTNLSG